MQISIHTGEPSTAAVDLLAVGVFADAPFKTEPLTTLDRALGGALKATAKDRDFTGKGKQRFLLHTLGKLRAKQLVMIGLGERAKIDAEALANVGAVATRVGNEVGAKKVLLVLPDDCVDSDAAAQIARGAQLGSYRFLEYKSDKGRKTSVAQVALHSASSKGRTGLQAAVKRGSTVAEGVMLTRDLVNRSALQLYPETFAAKATQMARKSGLKIKVLKPDQLKRMGMNLLLGVGAGSSRSPRLVHLTYSPPGQSKARSSAPIVLVGKGITFDSGGLSLKPSSGMVDMKVDMGGAGAVMGAMLAIAKLKPKKTVHGIVALAENMPSGTAIRPGDVITSAAGKTVEINNTDAEGRLVLADALHYAAGLKPGKLIDLATLTGACVVALGQHTVGLFANNDELADAILTAAKNTGEGFWRMPLTESLKSQLKSDVADMKNTGERWGGAITAALFLRDFVGKTAWAHLDIAGAVTSSKEAGALCKGATGVAVATLVDLIC